MKLKLKVKMVFGSHLYGTSSEESDTDYKGLFVPPIEDCILNKIPKSFNSTTGGEGKNNKDDIDEEYFSLQQFIKLAKQGEMIVIDMLHAPDDMLLETSDLWKFLRANRSKFYSKNLAGYLGYIRKQTAKYCVKGSRLSAMKEVIGVIQGTVFEPRQPKMIDVWNDLPINEYCYMEKNKRSQEEQYTVCGKSLQPTMATDYATSIIQKMYDRYGNRAKMGESNEGIDWKAISHAFRAGYQLKEIYETGDLIYPLKDAQFIKDVKYGKYHFKNDNIGEKLDSILDDINESVLKSDLPEKIDTKWLDSLILDYYKKN